MSAPKDEKPKLPRPEYTPEAWDDRARRCAAMGATLADIALILGIGLTTVKRWQRTHQSFAEAVQVGRKAADELVKRSLYEKAVGYTFTEEVAFKSGSEVKVVTLTKQREPDTIAAIFWLKNREPENWKDRTEKHHTGAVAVEHQDADAARAVIARFLEREKQRQAEEGEGTKH